VARVARAAVGHGRLAASNIPRRFSKRSSEGPF